MKAIHLKTELPNPRDVQDYGLFSQFEARSMHGQLPIIWDKAKDCNVWDRYGNKLLDFTSGIAVTNVGHGNANVIQGIQYILDKPLLHSYTFCNDARYWFLRELVETCYPEGKAFLVSSGTEATEAACKLMIMHGLQHNTEKKYIVSVSGGMHGRTLLAERLKGRQGDNEWASPYAGVIHLHPFETSDFLHEIGHWPEMVCGLMIESYQGWSARFYKPSYIQALVRWAKDNDVLVCFDEIQGGFGRTGKMFAYEHYQIDKPDLICLGKGVSSSVPLSGVLGRADILDIPAVGSMSSTHSGNPISCIAGLKTLLEMRNRDLVKHADEMGVILHQFLFEHFGQRYEINGRGLLAGIVTQTTEEATDIVWECFKRGLLLIWTHRNSVKIAPPLVITEHELLEGLGVLNEVLQLRNGS